jgi:hypothetical protein
VDSEAGKLLQNHISIKIPIVLVVEFQNGEAEENLEKTIQKSCKDPLKHRLSSAKENLKLSKKQQLQEKKKTKTKKLFQRQSSMEDSESFVNKNPNQG